MNKIKVKRRLPGKALISTMQEHIAVNIIIQIHALIAQKK
jgi:hypothetical protein